MAQQPKIQVKFEAKGSQALRQAILQLAKAQGILERDMKKVKGATHELNNAQEKYKHRVESNTKALGKQAEVTKKIQGFIAKYRNQLLLGAFAANTFKNTIGKLTDLYAVQEKAEKKLSTALGFTNRNLLDYASTLQKVSTFGDEVTITAMSQVAAFTKNEDAIKAITLASQDMAAARGMDLITTTDLVTKSIMSSTNALSRYGIEIDNSLTGADRLKAVVQALNEAYGGQALADLSTYSGAVQAMSNNFGDLGESVGKILAEALLPLVNLLNALAIALQQLPLKAIIKSMVALGVAVLATSNRMKTLRTSILRASRAFKSGAVASKKFATALKTIKAAAKALVVLEVVGFLINRISDIFGSSSKNVQEYAEEIDFTTEIFDKYSTRIKAASNDLDALKKIEGEAFSEKNISDTELKHLDKTAMKLQGVIDKYDAYDEFSFEGFAASATGTIPTLEFDEKQILDDAKRIIGELATITDESEGVITLVMGYRNFAQQEKDLRRILGEVNKEINSQTNENEQLTSSYDKASNALETYSQDIKDYRTDLFASAQKEVDLAEKRKKFSGAELEFEIKKFEAKQKLGKLYLSEDEENQLKDLIQQKYEYLEAEQNILEIQKAISAGQKKYLDSTKSEYVLLNEQIDNTADLINKIDFSTDEGVEQYDELLIIMGHLRNEMMQLEDIGLDVVDKDEAARITNLFKEVDKLNKSSLSTSTTLMMLRDDLTELYVALDTAGKNTDDLVAALIKLEEQIDEALDDEVQTFEEIKSEIANMTLALSDANLETELYNKLVTDKADLDATQIEAIKELIKAYIEAKKAAEDFKDETEEIQSVYKLVSDEAAEGFIDDFTNMLATAERLQDVSLKNLRLAWEKTIQQIAAKLITSGLIRLIGLIVGFISGDAKSGLSAAATFSQSLGYYHKGGKVKKYHSGGMIPSYHSGGNVEEVPIMAQEGEFVMQRSAVDSIGLENLNRMNNTGEKQGAVNINFTGNVMDKSYIERKAIPMIKQAIKRGHRL